MELFDRQWSSYRAIVEHDLMEHGPVAGATAEAIDSWLAARTPAAPAPELVDLGCGDLARLAPLLRRLPLAGYTGVDLAAVVLPLAERNLGAVPYLTRWRQGNLLDWALEGQEASTDILHSAFAIHHLDDEQKQRFLAAARRCIRPGGLFIWADVFRLPGEPRPTYLDRYTRRIESGWGVLDADQQAHVITHMHHFDLPAERDAIEAVAEACGWSWRWAWQGSHQAEALAVLTPVD